MTCMESIAWVDRFRPLIEKKMGVVYSHEAEDLIQDAYVAALMARKISAEKRKSFASVFWIILRRRNRREEKSIAPQDCVQYQDELNYRFGNGMPDPEEALLCKESPVCGRDAILEDFLAGLTSNQKFILGAVTGLNGPKMSYPEIESTLRITAGAISQTVSRLTRMAEAFRINRSQPGTGHVHLLKIEEETRYGSERSRNILRHTSAGYPPPAERSAAAGTAG